MHPSSLMVIIVLFLFIGPFVQGQEQAKPQIPALENPVNKKYLIANLRQAAPRLVLNPELEKLVQAKVKSDSVVRNLYLALQMNAQTILDKPLLERKKVGRRLLSVSREMLYRMNVLGMVYRIDRSPAILERINEELQAVCAFTDWNPSHYLDVAEMSMAVALGVDWAGAELPPATVKKAKRALIDLGIKPSYNKKGNTGWIKGTNNWNQVCHAGMIAAAIVVAEDEPALASKTIHRALEGMPHALIEYGPDGVYPEGSTYWSYGTSFTVLTVAMLESAFGTDFGITNFPAFKESALFRIFCNAPSGWYYNFADCGDKRSKNGDLTLAWFAMKTQNELFFERKRLLRAPAEMGKLPRYAGAALVWLAQYEAKASTEAPTSFKGDGSNPIVIFYDHKDPNQYYLGAKGGRGTVNHGNMDGGSFIFELNGVRWGIDPGNQSYHALEKTGFNLWGRCQECERWTLLTKNNFGHSTLTVNNARHVVDGLATITDYKGGNQPKAEIDLSPTFAGQLQSAKRTFIKDSKSSLVVLDELETLPTTKLITWQFMTTAEVKLQKGGALLKQDGKSLQLEILSHPEKELTIVALDPPPLALDRKIKGLKRLEIRYGSEDFNTGKGKIEVRLSEVNK